MDSIEVYIPVPDTRNAAYPLAPRLETLRGKKLAWLDNQKANAGELLRELAANYQANHSGVQNEFASKDATRAAPDALMAHLKTFDAVVLAIAD